MMADFPWLAVIFLPLGFGLFGWTLWLTRRGGRPKPVEQARLLVHFKPAIDFGRYVAPPPLPFLESHPSFTEMMRTPPSFVNFLNSRNLTFLLVNCSPKALVVEVISGKITQFGHVKLDKEVVISAEPIALVAHSRRSISYPLQLSDADQGALSGVDKGRAPIQVELTLRFSNKAASQKIPYLDEGDLGTIAIT